MMPSEKYHRTKRGPHHANCGPTLEQACLLKVVKQRDELESSLRALLRRAEYVCAHKYGRNDPVGTRVVAVTDLRDECARVAKALTYL
jgi:hypothetical protein